MLKFAPEIRADGIFYLSAHADDDFDTRGSKSFESLGAAVSSKDHLWLVACHVLGCLDTGPLRQIKILPVFDHLQTHGLRIHKQEVFGPAEARVYIRF